MSAFRAILVGFIALSLTVLPVSAAEMRSTMAAGMSDMAGHDDCCPQSGQCEKQSQKDCSHSGSCLLKCSILAATTVAAPDLTSPLMAAPKLPALIETLHSALDHPPLPPPRV